MSAPATSSLSSLIAGAQDFLRSLEGTERAVILTQEPGLPPALRSISGGLDPQDLDKDAVPGFALSRLMEGRKSVHSLDVTQDASFAACPRRSEVRSVLCVAVPGAQGTTGYLYADHTFKAGAFPHANLKAAEEYASKLGQQLEGALVAERLRPREGPAEDHHAPFKAAAVVVAAALLWAGLGVLMHTSEQPPPKPASITMQNATPATVTAAYLNLLKTNQLARAYEVLSPPRRQKLSSEKFQREVAGWLKEGSHRWELDYRHVATPVVTGRRAEVTVNPPPGKLPWRFELVQQEDGSWKLDRWQGGPLSDQEGLEVAAPSPSPFITYK